MFHFPFQLGKGKGNYPGSAAPSPCCPSWGRWRQRAGGCGEPPAAAPARTSAPGRTSPAPRRCSTGRRRTYLYVVHKYFIFKWQVEYFQHCTLNIFHWTTQNIFILCTRYFYLHIEVLKSHGVCPQQLVGVHGHEGDAEEAAEVVRTGPGGDLGIYIYIHYITLHSTQQIYQVMGQCNYHPGRLMLSGVRQIQLNMADWFLSKSLWSWW